MKNQITANTFTPLYDQIEDRIRFVVNYQDMQNRVDFMITRSFILNLIPTAEEFIAKHYKNETQIEDSITINSEKKENISQTDNVNLELLRTEEELLQEVNFSFDASTKHTTVTFRSKNIEAKAVFDASTIKQTFEVLKSVIPHIQWGIAYNF